ncbi:ABC-2 type transporter [Polystyrenella longa]|uniref:ABC-2 type transporter n=1 Tax=Polystyrenella longa TaxID=2528007 RepID=A0A518CM60_9PLAN|nr:ABC-2 family transporter protein [Polystyrenella longa]QDU80316.1 ABC-2 type transporter [Polystyrenella longa]
MSIAARSRTIGTILRICIEERLVYRGDFAFATLLRFFPIITQIFLWGAIYGVWSGSSQKTELNGYTFPNMVAYYLFAMLGRAFSSMPGLATGISRDVRDGTIKKYLTQPIDMLGYLFWHRVAHKIVYYVMATGPFLLVFFLCRAYLPGWPDGFTICAWILSLMMAFMVGFLIEALIGMISFWFLEVSSLLFIYMMFNFFLSGHMIPLDWIPDPWGTWMKMLPLKYLAYFPASIMLTDPSGAPKYTHAELINELSIEAMWIFILLVLNRIAYHRGTRRYGAFGG